jgi:OmpA-OmpF porin, OOP family
MRARTQVAGVTFLVAAVASARGARAQSPAEPIDAERFKPAITYGGFIMTEGSAVREELNRFQFGLALNYARNTLVVVDGNGDVTDHYVSGRLGADLWGSITIVGPFAIGLGLPFFLAQTGDASPSFAGLGDLRIAPKLSFIDNREEGGFGLGLIAELRAPTHTGDFSGGARNVVFAPRLVADYRTGGLHFGANGGVAIREGTQFVNIEAASEIIYAGALSYRFDDGKGLLEIGGEVNGGIGIVAADAEELPLEALPFLKLHPHEEWEIFAGPGVGLVPGYGIPIMRGFLGVKFSPTRHDRDKDGIADEDDKCPDEPENENGWQDTDGCPDEDKDDDVDGVANSKDECPQQKETINGVQDEDGCPDGGPAKVIREEGEIVITESVRFRSGSSEIDPESHAILNQVALVMKANPDIKKLRVEGHTDSTGDHDNNVRLSKERAASVRNYLVKRGVNPNRLTSEGYGPDKPKVDKDDPASLAKNRRVEFRIED